jgi:hypothetical protein
MAHGRDKFRAERIRDNVSGYSYQYVVDANRVIVKTGPPNSAAAAEKRIYLAG